ncbi:DNA-binding transcriptional regulator, GntR family [Arboricoccus pini]|uniref:DNA-binding transcriptional regulator, GntR family n=1 Tax=Arboricoccus pini TaxID=1963835 RepID=A0A212RL71_9PROT|nr:GntR family transcriptional regulator [Arboricoccus pini]SNB73155.1 DNA-binding transcriptional regulator, GntR family [Arboricoccus pini]
MQYEGTGDLTQAIPEALASRLEDDIIFGRLEPRARLTEEEVAAHYGVSRSPVREALRLLERDGLVNRAARRGIWVAPLSLKDFDEIYSCRIPLEGLAAGAAAGNDGPEKAQLLSLLPELERAFNDNDAQAFFQGDVKGSRLIYSLAANQTLTRLINSLGKQALRYRYFAYVREPRILAITAPGTQVIWRHIVQGDVARSKALTEELIHHIWQIMRDVIAERYGEA